jgi:DNA-binding beta-propeller fold protein YncE
VSFRVRFRQALSGLVGIVLLTVAQVAHATFSLTFQGNVQTINTGGSITLSSPSGIVVDPAGDIFIADTVSGSGRIVKVNAQGTASVLTISGLSPALGSLSGIAIDGGGNLYIADKGNDRVVEVASSGAGSRISTGSFNLSIPQGIAVDQSGDIFIADTGNSRIVEVASGGAPAALQINVSSGAPSLNGPRGIAVDVSGKLYIADSNNSRVVTVAAGSTMGVVFSTGQLNPALSNPSGVAVDRVGNVFIDDTGHNRIVDVDTAGNGNVLLNSVFLQGTTLSGPLGVAVDVFGGVYVADTGDSRALVVNLSKGVDDSSSLNKTAVGFGHISLGSSTPTSFILSFSVGYPVDSLGSVNAFTLGTQNLDFQIVSGVNTTCSGAPSITYCTVQLSFLPTAPGLRTGALVLHDPDMNPVLTLPLYGWGDSPVAVLAPNTGTVISTGALPLSFPFQLALDGAGNIYDANDGGNLVKIPAGGGSASVVSPTGYTVGQEVTGVALDGAGNLFISDHDNSRILVITPGGVASVLSITGLSVNLPTALAFDASGTLYIADYGSGRTIEVSSIEVTGSTSAGIGTVIGTGSYTISPEGNTGVAVDWMGNIYITDGYLGSDPSRIIKVTSAGAVSLVAPTGITLNSPQGVGVDAMGNIYVANGGNNRIVEINTAGVGSVLAINGLSTPATLGTPFGVTVDPFGNLYIPDTGNNRIVFVNVSGSALAFTNTATGTKSAAQTATVTNLGDQPLNFSTNPTYTASFSANTADTNLCTSTTSLLSGTSCDVSVQFTPQSVGSLSAGITVTDNALNVAGSTQQVSVTGTSFNNLDTTSTTLRVNPVAVVAGQTATLTAVVSDTTTPATVPAGAVSFSDTVGTTTVSLNGGAAVTLVAGTATLQVTPTVVGVHTITANFVGAAPKPTARLEPRSASRQFGSSSGSATLTVTGIAPTLSFGPIPAQTYGNPPFAVSASSASTGAVTFTVVSGPATISGNMVTLTGAGTVVVLASQAASGSYAAATATVSFTVAAAPPGTVPTLTFAPIPAQTYGNPPFAVSATSSSSGAVTYAIVSGPATIAGNMVTLTGAGTVVLSASQAASGNYAAATVTVTFTVAPPAVPPTGFTLTTGAGSGAESVLPGGAAAFNLVLAPGSGPTYPDALTLSATGLPAGATVTFSPATIPAGSGATPVTMTIQTINSQTARDAKPGGSLGTMALALLLLPMAGIKPVRRRLRKLRGLPVVAALALGAMVCLSGCTSNGFFNQAVTHYTVVITATDVVTAAHSSTNVTLTVQ